MSEKSQTLTKVKALKGTIAVPGDKSISHRAVMFGSIAEGTTKIRHFLKGQDCLSTIDCFRKLGVNITETADEIIVEGKGWNGLQEPKDILDVGNSGTTTRLMMGLLAAQPFHSVMIGDDSIAKRPMSRVTNPLKQMNASIAGRDNGNYTPLSITGKALSSITYDMPVASAQVKSAILLAGIQTEGTTTVIEKETTRDHTERMIKHFGGEIEVDGKTISVKGNQKLTGTTVNVPGDISSAAFFMVAAAIVPNSEVTLVNVGLNPTRTGIIDVLEQMGADMEIIPDASAGAEPTGTIIVRTSKLKGITIGGDLIPRLIDELPVIALLATQAEGTTIIKNAEELKVKETNRIDAVVNELQTLCANIEATDDGMVIHGTSAIHGGTTKTYGDHRIGMMLGVASLISSGNVEIKNVGAIDVSYPTFFDDLRHLIQ